MRPSESLVNSGPLLWFLKLSKKFSYCCGRLGKILHLISRLALVTLLWFFVRVSLSISLCTVICRSIHCLYIVSAMTLAGVGNGHMATMHSIAWVWVNAFTVHTHSETGRHTPGPDKSYRDAMYRQCMLLHMTVHREIGKLTRTKNHKSVTKTRREIRCKILPNRPEQELQNLDNFKITWVDQNWPDFPMDEFTTFKYVSCMCLPPVKRSGLRMSERRSICCVHDLISRSLYTKTHY